MTESIHGVRAGTVECPVDGERLTAVLAQADADRRAVCIAGGATKLGWGNRPERLDLLVSTREMRSRCDVDADDLIVTASAGFTVAEVRMRARQAGRVLPLDAGCPDRATVGGVAATGDQGARGAGYGRVRDLALGLKATLADGTQVKFGGRTMKNVAGYDMSKLFVGSFGVLGVITEVTFRLLPRPESHGMLVIPSPSFEEAAALVARILHSGLQPLVLQIVPPSLAVLPGTSTPLTGSKAQGECILLAGFAGHPAALDRSLADVSGWSQTRETVQLADEDMEAVLESLAGRGAPGGDRAPSHDEVPVKVRAAVPVAETCRFAEAALSLGRVRGLTLEYQVNAGTGIVDLWEVDRQDSTDRSRALTDWVVAAREAATARGGGLAVVAGLLSLAAGLDAWGETGASVRLMKAIKQRFDPHRTLNPGRFVGGI